MFFFPPLMSAIQKFNLTILSGEIINLTHVGYVRVKFIIIDQLETTRIHPRRQSMPVVKGGQNGPDNGQRHF